MKCCHVLLALLLTCGPGPRTVTAQEKKGLGVQFAGNPPMQVISKTPPAPAVIKETFEIREGFTLVKTLDEFRAAIKKDKQKIRMKPGVYRAEKVDPPMMAYKTGQGR
jgi:hypothetical protein